MMTTSLEASQSFASGPEPGGLVRRLRERLEEMRRAELQGAQEAYAAAFDVCSCASVAEAAAAAERALANATTRRHTHAIHVIDEALARIDTGHFAHCIECHGPIAAEYLLAQPTTQRCEVCQDACEHTLHHHTLSS